jgi:hypothetical protein
MPAITQPYEVLLDFTNDTHDFATVQLLREYGRSTSAVVLLSPGESITLVLEAGSVYKYALKSHSKVANVRCVSEHVHPSSARFSCAWHTAHGVGETFNVKYRIYLLGDHQHGLLYAGLPVRPPPVVSLSTEYGGTIGSMFGMML